MDTKILTKDSVKGLTTHTRSKFTGFKNNTEKKILKTLTNSSSLIPLDATIAFFHATNTSWDPISKRTKTQLWFPAIIAMQETVRRAAVLAAVVRKNQHLKKNKRYLKEVSDKNAEAVDLNLLLSFSLILD
ncbi:Hypothetical predicted protein [Octopus vulgaris]|uniref:Uncharacterized protein n=1 Tax=Octopus vulgaris TaxID=6645 RepID=A0AA36EXY8_OCTVU|nr:Hypothetical predicted protein [Octopus vulgaris]